MWSKFFDYKEILQHMEFTSDLKSVVDLGCVFGAFSIPASLMIKGKIHAFDIDPEMIGQLKSKINHQKIENIELNLADMIADGSGLPDNSIGYIMLFNILHDDNQHQIFNDVHRILKPNAKPGIIHWRSDISTPRVPKLEIRPKPEQFKQWATLTGFDISKELILEPYHFGIIITKN